MYGLHFIDKVAPIACVNGWIKARRTHHSASRSSRLEPTFRIQYSLLKENTSRPCHSFELLQVAIGPFPSVAKAARALVRK